MSRDASDSSRDASTSSSSADFDTRRRERLERRMRAAYSRSANILGELVNDHLDAPYRVSSIRFEGAHATRDSFLAQICRPLLESSQNGLRGVLQASRRLQDSLSRFGIFETVDTSLERSPSMLADEGDVDLIVKVKEAPRFRVQAGTDIGNNEGSATGSMRVRNVFGGAEVLEGFAAFGTRTKSRLQGRFETPIPGWPSPERRIEVELSAVERDWSQSASCKEYTRGGTLKYRTLSRLGQHELSYDLYDRHLSDLEPHASLSMRKSAGHHIKSAVAHSVQLQHPTLDGTLKLTQEYAGLGGDAHHFKASSEASAVHFVRDMTLSATLRSGLLFPLNRQPSAFSDRFQLGGPTSVRSFKVNGIGPKDNGDFLGGNLMWSAGLSAFHPVPRRREWPVQLHGFVNAGRLAPYRTDDTPLGNVSQLFQRPVASAGIGLAYSNGPVRLEVNFALPLMASSSDATSKGLSVGLGVDFL